MGNRFVLERAEKAHISFERIWTGIHQGKYWKRQMNKARRRAWKQNGLEGVPNNRYESLCDYKNW
jgi:hypothetical protein